MNQNHYQKNEEGIAKKGKTGADDELLIPAGTNLFEPGPFILRHIKCHANFNNFKSSSTVD